jgi:hypothetical protein
LQGLNLAIGAPLPYKPLFFKVDSHLFRQFQRLALPAGRGIGGKTQPTDSAFWGRIREARGKAPDLSGACGVSLLSYFSSPLAFCGFYFGMTKPAKNTVTVIYTLMLWLKGIIYQRYTLLLQAYQPVG